MFAAGGFRAVIVACSFPLRPLRPLGAAERALRVVPRGGGATHPVSAVLAVGEPYFCVRHARSMIQPPATP